MKNILCIFGLLILLCGCERKTTRFRIGVSQCSEDEWRAKMNNEILREAQFYEGVDVEIRSAKDNNREQIADIRYFIDEGVDLLIVAPNEAVPITPIIEEAYNKNIPVIIVDRMILSEKYTAFIGADNFEIGRSVGDYIVANFPKGGKIAELSGLAGSTPAIDRHQGFISVINRYPQFEIVTTRDAGWLAETAEEVMEEILKEETPIDILFAHNDRMAGGAYLAAQRAGREQEIKFLGIDALPGHNYGLDLVLNEVLDATFIYPTDGDKVMRIAMDILEGRPYERETTLFTAAISEVNARVMRQQTNYIDELDKKIKFLNLNMDQFLVRFANQQMLLYGTIVILILLSVIVLLILKAYRTKTKLNRKLSERNSEITTQKEQLEIQRDQLLELSKQLEEATHAKLVFFTNISHDFRTPLTLISDPVNQLLEEPSLPETSRNLLKLVRKNVNILLRLINQILDFRKYENGKLDLVPISFNIQEQLEEWSSAFTTVALKKHIRFKTIVEPGNYQVTADLGKIERVCYNLLSNAFKFTPENGKITLHLSTDLKEGESFIKLAVSDTGIGISPQHVQNIFERFYMTDYQYAGSGIGLALTKAFIELHKGEITVESSEGTGSVFTISIPAQQPERTDAPEENTCVYEPLIPAAETTESLLPATGLDITDEEEKLNAPSVLIIDDNTDIRTYIKSFLGNQYLILEAENGKEGIKKAMKYVPDVIICDILMPVMDGIECCRILKSELQTSHIPVIMLTACALDEQRITGFETGADSYIAKPFNSKVLAARVKNLIANRQHLKQFFGDTTSLAKESISDLDKEFVDKFKKLIEENISNSAFSVEEMGEEMGLSRVQVYRKIKSLTNYSPNELLRITRLKKAASLLASTEMTIAEITYEVGFSSPSYFTKCYKEYFGEKPGEFLKRKG